MHVVTTRDFRANQRKYFEMAEKEPVIVMRRGARPISISVVDDGDIMSEAELKSIRRGLEDIKSGKVYKMSPAESLDSFIDRIDHV
ncbi:MAG: prevent-host-death protein [Muribaculaceae bacterium]|nr:prevent-host-death protein [Muribaculaceae bacterium]